MDISNKIEIVETEKLIPYHNNPKEHPPEQIDKIASSIKNYGFVQPLVIDSENEIIIGHGRLKAAKKLGLEEIPVVVKGDLNEAQVKALRIADNKVAESEWNMEALAVEFDELEFEEFDLNLTGFEEVEQEGIMEELDIDEFFDKDETDDEEMSNTEDKEVVVCPRCGEEIEV